MYIYIIGQYNPSVGFTNYLLTTFVLFALIVSITGGTYWWTGFWEMFHGNFILLSEFLPEIRNGITLSKSFKKQ